MWYRIPTLILISVALCPMAALPTQLSQWENEQVPFSTEPSKPVGLPSSNPTRSFWGYSSPDANPLAREGSTGPLTTDADVCIIGSGMTGVGVAYHLSEVTATTELQSPLTVVILEARDFCAGATGRNGGHLAPYAFSGFHARATKYGPEEARRSYALEAHTASSLACLIDEHGWAEDVNLVNGGRVDLFFTHEEAELSERDREAAVHAGWPLDGVAALTKDEVEETFGAHYPAVKVPGYNLWPVKLVTKLYEEAMARTGAHFDLALHTHTPVTEVRHVQVDESSTNTTRAYTLSTPRGTIACSRVVHATNAYASHLLPFLAGQQGIFPVRGQVIATRAAVSADEITTNGWTANKGYEYWFPRPVKTPDERPLIILGGGREVAYPSGERYIDDDSTLNPAVGEKLRAFLPVIFEGKFDPGQEPEMEWTGIMGNTAIGDPFVGPVHELQAARGTDAALYPGQFIAAGYSGHGMPRAFGCAEVIAQMILAELAGKPWVQPEWLPMRYLTWAERGPASRN